MQALVAGNLKTTINRRPQGGGPGSRRLPAEGPKQGLPTPIRGPLDQNRAVAVKSESFPRYGPIGDRLRRSLVFEGAEFGAFFICRLADDLVLEEGRLPLLVVQSAATYSRELRSADARPIDA